MTGRVVARECTARMPCATAYVRAIDIERSVSNTGAADAGRPYFFHPMKSRRRTRARP